jgi:hypothetical protein
VLAGTRDGIDVNVHVDVEPWVTAGGESNVQSLENTRRGVRVRTVVVFDSPARGARRSVRVVCRRGQVVLGLRLAAAANVKLLLDLVHGEVGL